MGLVHTDNASNTALSACKPLTVPGCPRTCRPLATTCYDGVAQCPALASRPRRHRACLGSLPPKIQCEHLQTCSLPDAAVLLAMPRVQRHVLEVPVTTVAPVPRLATVLVPMQYQAGDGQERLAAAVALERPDALVQAVVYHQGV